MTVAFKQVIENIKSLSADEKALIAHCLISSLESSHDEEVDDKWLKISEKRLLELESGEVDGVSWNDIRSRVIGKDA